MSSSRADSWVSFLDNARASGTSSEAGYTRAISPGSLCANRKLPTFIEEDT
jgi:hypothetical protein